MKSQPLLPLRAMAGYVVMQLQASVSMSMIYVTTRDHEDVPRLGSHLGPQRSCGSSSAPSLVMSLWKAGPTSHQWQNLGQREIPAPHLGSTAKLILVQGLRSSRPEGMS